MAIKNKDGSVYSLEKPNELMVEQTLWTKKEKFTIHNTFGKIAVFGIPTDLPFEAKEPERVSKPIIIETRPELEKIQANKPTKRPTIQVWCLPAQLEETIDPLYNEKYGRIVYGNRFVFNAIVESQSDLHINLWTNNSVITEGSVIYPSTSDKRWWRIYSVSSAEEGKVYNLKASVTDYHPSFSA